MNIFLLHFLFGCIFLACLRYVWRFLPREFIDYLIVGLAVAATLLNLLLFIFNAGAMTMGDAADDILEGLCCQVCGEWFGDILEGEDAPGHPRWLMLAGVFRV